jgi:hypothetical protein
MKKEKKRETVSRLDEDIFIGCAEDILGVATRDLLRQPHWHVTGMIAS